MRHYLYPKRDNIGLKGDKKILVTNSVHTRPGQENSKKIEIKFKKLKNPFVALFIEKMDVIGQEIEKKIIDLNSVHTRSVEGNSEKNS